MCSRPGCSEGIELGFLARALVQATLPHRDPGCHEFVRRNGRYTLSILAPAEVGLPYGRYPRLVLAWLCTEAVRRRTRRLSLGESLSSFSSRLGVAPTSGPRGSLTHVKQQMQRLFATTFQCVFQDDARGEHAGDGFLITERRHLWWDPRPRSLGRARIEGYVELSDRFFREATEAPVPLDLRVLRSLRAPLEIDLYVWLTFRFYGLRREILISWRTLMLQFGAGYTHARQFRHRLLAYLRDLQRYYPAARVASTAEGLVLRPSAPHVRPMRLQPPTPLAP